MIGCEISGGLGNQFFRYAYARCLHERRRKQGMNDELAINYAAIENHGFAGDLNDFRITEHSKYNCRRVLLEKGSFLQIIVYAVVTRVFSIVGGLCKCSALDLKCRILSAFGIVISEDPDNERLYCNMKAPNLFPIGSFENVNYFNEIKEILSKEFTPVCDGIPANKKLYDAIRKGNSVCLAVRRGDFMKEANKKNFYVCDLTYFQKAVDYIRKNVENPTFIVFSNDIAWVKANLKIGGGKCLL